MLEADQATQAGDHENEYIAEQDISGDEIGQIMRSRNATVRELRRHEEELLRKNELLERQDRLASLGMLSASVAHELNTPLSVLHGSIEKLQETVAHPQAQDRLARMLRVTQRLRRISEGLIDFARVRKEELGPVHVRAVIEESWGLVAIDEKAGEVHFHNRVPESVRVRGNADRLVQVFVNLLRNSMCALQPGGNIIVESHCVSQDDRPLVSITVEDDGPGIPTDVLPNIFEAFVTTRLDSRGTGLGLTVAEGIISQHGGTIQASNRPGGGARLEVRLPTA
jgi:signal transduction histidine kinase